MVLKKIQSLRVEINRLKQERSQLDLQMRELNTNRSENLDRIINIIREMAKNELALNTLSRKPGSVTCLFRVR